MSSGLVLSLILLAVVTMSLIYIIQAEGGISEIPRLMERVGLPTQWLGDSISTTPPVLMPSRAVVRPDFTSGNSRFSQGSCRQDSDCQVSGCSSEICGAEAAISTCEYSEDFPSTQTHSCGCIASHCGWQEK